MTYIYMMRPRRPKQYCLQLHIYICIYIYTYIYKYDLLYRLDIFVTFDLVLRHSLSLTYIDISSLHPLFGHLIQKSWLIVTNETWKANYSSEMEQNFLSIICFSSKTSLGMTYLKWKRHRGFWCVFFRWLRRLFPDDDTLLVW